MRARALGYSRCRRRIPMNLIHKLEKEQIEKLSAGKEIPDFAPGDTVLVNVKVVEGDRTRIQAYEGVCIGRAGAGLNENFTVRKISYGEGVERVFPLYSPMIDSIKLVRRGKVRRAKLYYLRGRRGKAARIGEKQDDFEHLAIIGVVEHHVLDARRLDPCASGPHHDRALAVELGLDSAFVYLFT